MDKSKAGIVICLLIGIPLAIFGIKELLAVKKFVAGGVRTEGTIMEMKEGPTKFYPRVQFATKDGRTMEFSSGNGSNPPMYKPGDTVPVIYNPNAPQYAVINTFIDLWLGPTIYATAGLLFLVGAIATTLARRPTGSSCVSSRNNSRM